MLPQLLAPGLVDFESKLKPWSMPASCRTCKALFLRFCSDIVFYGVFSCRTELAAALDLKMLKIETVQDTQAMFILITVGHMTNYTKVCNLFLTQLVI